LQSEAQGLLDYAQPLIEGDELMFIMDVPYIPAQDTPIVLAQATTPAAGATPRPDYILQTCGETVSTGDPQSAMRGVDPAGLFAVYLQNHDKRTVDMAMLAAIKTTMLEGTKHGKIFSEVDNLGLTSYHYDPEPSYIGNDRAIFLAEFEGKVYKIVVELHVFMGVDENSPSCPPPTLIKVNGKPVSGSSSFDLNSIPVTFSDLTGAAIGQTAGYNWFIDTTPADNSEFLPTSNPNEWVAKAGSEAAGKMDMLSVLLHEYGHALGINHSADPNDYMGTKFALCQNKGA
jgi:hypothetical protein